MPKLQFLEAMPESGLRRVTVDRVVFWFDPFCDVPQEIADHLLAPALKGKPCSFRLVTEDAPAPAPVVEAVAAEEEAVPEAAPAPAPKRPRGRPRKK
jgi:hypothetical protein